MKLSFSTLGCPDWSFGEIITSAKDLGYQGVEIRGIEREIYAPAIKELTAEREQTIEKLKALGIEIAMLTAGTPLAVHGVQEQAMKEGREYIDVASSLGVKYIRFLSTDKPYFDGGDPDLCKRQFAELVGYAQGKGVTPLIETNGLFLDSKKLADFLDEVGGDCGALWDVHHPYCFNDEPVEKTIENLGLRIKYVHLKDSKIEKGAPVYKMMGYGDIPLEKAIRLLIESGYEGYFSLEWVKRWNKELEEPGIVFAHYVNYMRQFDK